MNPENIFNLKNVKTILLIAVIMVIFGLVISLVQAPKYKSSAKLLVIFNSESSNPYASIQTSNHIASILEEVIYADSFIENVLKSNFDIDNHLGFNQEEKIKKWRKMVKTNLQDSKGILIIDVYHKDREQANNFAQAIGYTMITNHSLYHGSGSDVAVKMIGVPTTPQNWATPNIAQNLLLSLIVGVFVGLTFVIVFPQQELINFIIGKKVSLRDETFSLANNRVEQNIDPEVVENSQPSDDTQQDESNQYYNW
jgi:capsular polysaccharide biosynthesis protein